MSRRGNVLLLVMLVIAMGAAASAVFLTRLSVQQHGWQADQIRVQTLWLARSALDAGVVGQRQVTTALGEATVEVEGSGESRRVQVTLQGAQATIQHQPYLERFEQL